MVEETIKIPRYLNQLSDILKSYEFHFREHLDDFDLTMGELPILLGIYENEGLNQIDLVKKFHVTEANISKTTKHLLQKGLIIKEVDAENNTKKLLFLTEDGEKLCIRLGELFEEWKDMMVGEIPKDDLIVFSKVLLAFSENANIYLNK